MTRRESIQFWLRIDQTIRLCLNRWDTVYARELFPNLKMLERVQRNRQCTPCASVRVDSGIGACDCAK